MYLCTFSLNSEHESKMHSFIKVNPYLLSNNNPFFLFSQRNVLLKMFILAVLCYHWMNVVAKFSVGLKGVNSFLPSFHTPLLVLSEHSESFMNLLCAPQCWESIVGQALYRLVIVDFLFLMLGSFFGEFLSK